MTDLARLQMADPAACPSHIRQSIEQHYTARAEMQRNRNKLLQVEFFIGAMAALEVLGYAAPTAWVTDIQRGKCIA